MMGCQGMCQLGDDFNRNINKGVLLVSGNVMCRIFKLTV